MTLNKKVILTAAFAALAYAGNQLNLSLVFGLDVIFGSIVTLLALSILGLVPALLVSLVGSLFTIQLWGHPYAVILFFAETLAVGLLLRRFTCHLTISDAAYWMLIGIPLNFLFYHGLLDVGWTQNLVIAFKQALNGILNATLASLILLAMQSLSSFNTLLKTSKPSIADIFFNTVLTLVLLAGLTPIVIQSRNSQADAEQQITEHLEIIARQVVKRAATVGEFEQASAVMEDDISLALLSPSGMILSEHGKVMSLHESGTITQRPDATSIWLPTGSMSAVQRWHRGAYVLATPVIEPASGNRLIIEQSATELVDRIEAHRLLTMSMLLIIGLVSIAIVNLLSRWISRPLGQLTLLSQNLIPRVRNNDPIEIPSNQILEYEHLAASIGNMADALKSSFLEQKAIHDSLEQQVHERTAVLRQREAMLTESEARFRNMADSAPALIWLSDPQDAGVWFNRRWLEYTGRIMSQELGQGWRDSLHPEDSASYFQARNNAFNTRKRFEIEFRLRQAGGGYGWVADTGIPRFNTDGEFEGYIGYCWDITERKSAELALAESRAQLEAAQHLAKLGSWEADLQSGELRWSDEMFGIFGIAPANFNHRIDTFFKAIHPEDQAQMPEQERIATRTGAFDYVHRIIRPDGDIRHIHELATSRYDSTGKLIGLSGTAQDITELKRTEQALIAAKEAAESASRAKSEFLASMSHELRTPLNSILGFAQLFRMDTSLSSENRENAAEIERAGQHLLALVSDMIDLARIEAGRLGFSLEPVSLNSTMQDCLTMVAPLAEQQGIKMISPNTYTQEIRVRADLKRLRQVIINLLTNAIKYNRPQGTVRFSYEQEETSVRISVTDNGAGIPADKQSRIFTAFDRLGKESGTVEGTGIGLVIAKRLVQAMGGEIGFESVEGQGSTFWLRFTIDSIQTVEPSSPLAISNPQPLPDASPNSANKVLYIEDNPMNQRLMQQIFIQRPGLQLYNAHSAEIGVDVARQEHPALIMLDINLPGVDGYEALRWLKADSRTADIPVIAISANAMKGDTERGLEAGFLAYITKPINVPELLATIDQHLPSS